MNVYKYMLYLLFPLFQIAVGQGNPEFRCDYQYIEDAKGFFKYQETPAVWHEADLRCFLEGAILASPLSQDINRGLSALYSRLPIDSKVFTGLHSAFSRGDFFSVEGVPLNKVQHAWRGSEPNNYRGTKSCISLYADFTLGLEDCEDALPYFCYKPLNESLVINSCGTVDPDYIKDDKTGSCYKIHAYAKTWSRAFMTCAAEGASLVVINSENEANVVKDVFTRAPAYTIKPASVVYKDIAFIGFHDWGEHGSWRTIDGQSLDEAGYSKFSPGEPNNITKNGEFCGSVYRSGLLNDLGCELLSPFICEKEPSYNYGCDTLNRAKRVS